MVRLVVNGEPVTLDLDPSTPLIAALRHDLGLTAVRAGCGIGECGACVVLADGAPLRSCQTPLAAVDGAAVTTADAVAGPVRRAFLDEQAAQCGFCVNGVMMSVAAVLARTPAADGTRLREALDGHLCRCGTHHRILRAACRAAGHEVPAPAPPMPAPVAGHAATDFASEELPAVLRAAPHVEQWLRPLVGGRVEVFTGRVELGQGVRTALAQIVAAELDLPLDRVVVRAVATDTSPDEGYTAGSNSLQTGGAALAYAAACYRRLRAAGVDPPRGPIRPDDRPWWRGGALGEPAARTDLAGKLGAAPEADDSAAAAPAYLHDLTLPGMVFARALLPPTYDARPVTLDTAAAATMPGVVHLLHDSGVVVVVAERDEQAAAALARLARTARWDDPGPTPEPDLATADGEPVVAVDEPGVDRGLAAGRQVCATYTKPYEAHAAVAPSAAVAWAQPEVLRVWTHSQGVFPLRRELATLLGEDETRLVVQHVDGPGCYGHNGADDAAGFAVLAARAVPGRPVRFQFSVRDEFAWEPYGAPARVDLSAALDGDGHVAAWRHLVRTGPQMSRPRGSGDRLAVAWLRSGGPPRPATGGGAGGVRNAVPLYELGARDIRGETVPVGMRTSSLRSLGAYANVFAIESFVDELAEAAGADPLEFRLAHLRDPRAQHVLELAARTARWCRRVGPSGEGGRGLGLAVARYHDTRAYVAQVIEVQVDTTRGAVAVRRVVTVCDAGVVVNPDGLRNQLEGGTLHSLSRARFEQVHPGVAGLDWTGYPVLRFADVPDLETVLVDRPGSPPLGAGEAATPVTPAALANAVDDAVGIRVRDLPLTADRLRQRLAQMSEADLARVRV